MSPAWSDQSWVVRAACATSDPDDLFVRGVDQRHVRHVCFACPVRVECLVDALEAEANYGVWGSLTERERRTLLRRNPNEKDWYRRIATSTEDWAQDVRAGRAPRITSRDPNARRKQAVDESVLEEAVEIHAADELVERVF